MDSRLYIIEGDLTPLVRTDLNKKRIWDFTSRFKVANHLSLVEQHGTNPQFEGPLHVEVVFYLTFPGSNYKAREYNGRYHLAKPTISGLLVFIETVGSDIIFKSSAHIASINIQKLYDSDRPRVEFTLNQIRAGGEKL